MEVDTDLAVAVADSKEIALEEESPLASVVVEYEDSELSSFSQRLEHWSAVLKNSLLAEYEENRNHFTLKMISENENTKSFYQEQVDALKTKLELEQTALSASNHKLELKEKLVNNLSLYYSRKESKLLVRKSFTCWRDAFETTQGVQIAYKLAKKQHNNALLRKVIKGWRGVVDSTWKKGVERGIHRDADFRIAMAAKESDQQIKKLERTIQNLESQLQDARSSLKSRQEEMKSAFLRGVSALNAQAIGIFKDGDDQEAGNLLQDGQKLLNYVSSNHGTAPLPTTAPPTSKVIYTKSTVNGSISSTKGLVTRHFPAK